MHYSDFVRSNENITAIFIRSNEISYILYLVLNNLSRRIFVFIVTWFEYATLYPLSDRE